MKASIVIPTRNRAEILSCCLDSLVEQSAPAAEFEVVVVDNGSTDGTKDVVEKYSGALQLQYVYSPEPGLHVGRHEGMRRARSDILMFADDDIQASPSWVAAVVDAFLDERTALVGGNDLPLFESLPPSWLERWWNQSVGHGRALGHLSILDFGRGRFEIDPGYVWGCNFSIRKSALQSAGGFHPDALPQNRLRFRGDGETHVSDAVRKSGMRAMFDSAASVHHRVTVNRMTPEYFVQRAYAQGISHSYSVIRRHGGLREPMGFGYRQRLRRFGSGASARIKAGAAGRDAVARELESIKAETTDAFWRGYAFHRQEARADKALLSWILQPTYLDATTAHS